MELNLFDVAIIAVILLSAIIGLFRGLVREVLSLLGWIIAIWVAWVYAPQISNLFASFITSPDVQKAAAFITLFLVTLVLIAILAHFICKVISASALKATDRTLGMVFGTLRGILLVAVVAILIQSSPFAKESWWLGSALKGYFIQIAWAVIAVLPPEVAQFFGQKKI
ncbi:MAG TPA: colicin V production CvpA [Gammaproteobacteria bacterium]|nr:colicin V production CvpA [Gammaproteobacteria bacterium]